MNSAESGSLDDAIARLDRLLARTAGSDPAVAAAAVPSKEPLDTPARLPEPALSARVQADGVVDGTQRPSGFAESKDMTLLREDMRLIRDDLERIWQAVQAGDRRGASETAALTLAALQQSVNDGVIPQGKKLIGMIERLEVRSLDRGRRWAVMRTLLAFVVGVGAGFMAAILTYPLVWPWLSAVLAVNP